MKKLLTVTLVMMFVLGLMGGVAVADGFEYISTNDENRDADLPHVNVVGVGQDWIEFDFVNPTVFLFAFEYRVDGEDTPYPGYEHPITGGDYYHIVNVDGRDGQHLVNMTINANEKVEVRLALGAENDWYFDWTTFYVEPAIEYEAAPAVAARLLDDAGVDNRYGQGRDGGNFIADVARHMEDTTDFDGVSKEDVGAYECAVAAFLNDPANGEPYYPAGVECTPQYEFVEKVEVDSAEILGADTLNMLDEGIEYKFVASGTWVNGNVHDGVDAEYRLPAGEEEWESSVGRSLRLQVNEEYFNWSDGVFNPEHIYEAYFTGEGSLVNFRINDGDPPRPEWYGDNEGSLFVDIYKVNW